MSSDKWREKVKELLERRERFCQCVRESLEKWTIYVKGKKLNLTTIDASRVKECYVKAFYNQNNSRLPNFSAVFTEFIVCISRIAKELGKKYVVYKYRLTISRHPTVHKIFLVDDNELSEIRDVFDGKRIKIINLE